MSNLPANFPYGKSMWIWQLWTCFGKKDPDQITLEDYQLLIKKLKDNDIQIVLIKCGDGESTWRQWKPELVKAFHDAEMKIFSWSFIYGKNPEREAAIALWALDMGADGHVFDAEGQYEKLPNPGLAATTMLKAVRAHAPNALLGHSPFPIIDSHQYFPYIEFGKYCDFVMPQVYYGEWKVTPTEAILRMSNQFTKWEEQWKKNGYGDSIKPIIPLCQCYDDYSLTPNFVLTPGMIHEFVKKAEGYRAVSFWEHNHIFRDDCWTAIKESKVLPPEVAETKPVESVTTQPITEPVAPVTPADSIVSEPIKDGSGTSSTPIVDVPQGKITLPQVVQLPPAGSTTITVKQNEKSPDGIDIKVVHHDHVPHALVLKAFILRMFSIFSLLKSKLPKRGGVK